MSRGSLTFAAVVLGGLIVLVPFLGLDGLPRSVRGQIDAEQSALAKAQAEFRTARDEVFGELQSERDLFRGIESSRQWPGQLTDAAAALESAGRSAEELARLEKQNRRNDAPRVTALISLERSLRERASQQAATVRKDAAHWVELKNNLPELVRQMDQDYQSLAGFDLSAAAADVQHAGSDWPEKKADLESRLAAMRTSLEKAQAAWPASAEARRAAAAQDFAHVDFGALFGAADTLHTAAASLPQDANNLKALTRQLYDAWDKVLVDMEVRDGDREQKIRTIRTHFRDAAGQNGETTSEEAWVKVPAGAYDAMKRDLGMSIAHKAAGKYDSEADRVTQPAGFAYMAPPSQARNQYGYWEQRNGQSFWVFYGQYALLRDLLFNRDYRRIDPYEYEQYRTQQNRGQTYYGNDNGAPKYGSQGTETQRRYSGSTYSKSGGFKDSKYATQSGGYRDSKYASPSSQPKTFGSGSRRPEERRASPPPSRPSYRPSSPSRSSPGRTFGGRRR